MDNKNVFVAIALSMSVLLFWGAFFETPRQEQKLSNNTKVEKGDQDNNIVPNLNPEIIKQKISREDSLVKSNRVIIENNKVLGSLSLQGAIIDDLSFKNYRKELGSDKKVVLLNPKETEDGYFIETGWTSVGDKINVPKIDTIWQVKGNKILNKDKPITLEWNNNEGLIFKKIIELDDKYLFRIRQEVSNKTNKAVELYPYAQITRNKKPDDVMGFYILHEGFIGVFDGELIYIWSTN